MSGADQSVRTRAFINDQFWLLIVVLLLVLAGSGWWAAGIHLAGPEEQIRTQEIEVWSEATGFNHSAVITQENIIDGWTVGEPVQNRPLYYFNLSPVLNGTYTYAVTDDKRITDSDLSVETDIVLVIRGVEEGTGAEGQEEILWEYTEPLNATDERAIAPGEQTAIEYTVDIEHVLRTINRIQTMLDAQVGLIEVRVETVSVVNGVVATDVEDRDGESVTWDINETHESAMPMVVRPETYRVLELETVNESHTYEEESRQLVEPDHSRFAEIGSLAVFNLALFGLMALIAGMAAGKFDLSEEERELLELEQEREEFDEWITTGKFPADRDYEATVLVDDLMGLVDVAIDTNNRVIEDPELGVSTVLEDNYVYVYIHPDSPARDWLVNYADTTLDEFDEEGML